jgi:SAM-dependent methyltransferase
MSGRMIPCPVCGCAYTSEIAQDRFEPRNRYLRCIGCGCGYSARRVSDIDEAARIHTAAYYSPAQDEFRAVPAAEAHFLARLTRFVSSGRLLDVGCGKGRWLQYLRDHSSFRVEGVEPSPEAAEHARHERGIDVRTGDVFSASYPDETFDAAYLRNVLEHMAEPRALVKEIRRILKPGGVAAVHVPNDASFTNAVKRPLYRSGKIPECGSLFFPIHLNGFTTRALDILFREAGFDRLGRETLSKAHRAYEFPFVSGDIPLLPVACLESITGRGNLILGWYARR